MTTTAPSTTSTDSAGVTVGELAAALGMSRSSILRAVESGRFPRPMDERRHGWRVWHPAVALALEVGARLGGAHGDVLSAAAFESMLVARRALVDLPDAIVVRLPRAMWTRVVALRAEVPS